MNQNDALEKLIDNSFGNGLSSLATSPQHPEKKKRPKEQIRIVEEKQNENRKGAGKKMPEERTMVSFKVATKIAAAFQDVHYSTGKTLTELYEEAMLMIIKKYK